jgi:hypothetical protein
MRSLLLLAGAALALSAGAASAQFADPRTAAGAAGQISGKPAPDIDTPAKIDPSRDPAVNPPGRPLPQVALPPDRKPAETTTSAPAEDDPRASKPIRTERAEPDAVVPRAPPYLRQAY